MNPEREREQGDTAKLEPAQNTRKDQDEFDLTLDPDFIPLQHARLPARDEPVKIPVKRVGGPSAHEVSSSEMLMEKIGQEVGSRLMALFERVEGFDPSTVSEWGLGVANAKWLLKEDKFKSSTRRLEDAMESMPGRFQFVIVADDEPVGTAIAVIPSSNPEDVSIREVRANRDYARELAEQADILCGKYGVSPASLRILEAPARHVHALWITEAEGQVVVPICEPERGYRALRAHEHYSAKEFLDLLKRERPGGGLNLD